MAATNGRWSLLPIGAKGGEETSLSAYLARDGYAAARRAVDEGAPETVVATVERAGLRGCGGAGFPAALKWQLARDNAETRRYIVANAYDADPAAPIGRTLLERNPHTVLEGIAIAAYAVGAHEAYVYCRAEGTLALQRLRAAIAQGEEHGLLGEGAFAGRWPLIVRVAIGWGGFAGGEETAALAAIQGERAMPRQKPPYPTDGGLWDCPTVVHSAETLARLPAILRGEDGAARGKIVALGDEAAEQQLVEVALGTPLREIVALAGDGRALRAVQVGGPSGAVLPAALLDTPYDYDALAKAGAFVGSGSVHLLGEGACAVDFARDRITYLAAESCGKCVPCRLGLSRIAITLETIASGLGRDDDLALLEEYAEVVASSSLCGLGITAAAVLRSTLKHFAADYRNHIASKQCPSGRCRPMRTRRMERKTAL